MREILLIQMKKFSWPLFSFLGLFFLKGKRTCALLFLAMPLLKMLTVRF